MAFHLEKCLHRLLTRSRHGWRDARFSEPRGCADETPGYFVFLGEMLRQCADTEGLGRVVTGIYDRELVFFSMNSGPVRSLAYDQRVDSCGVCFSERFC